MKTIITIAILVVSIATFAQPTITSFYPISGPIGTSVIITGTNFNANPANNIVFFGATKATVTSVSATSLTVTVPNGATYQPISVTNFATGLTAYSRQAFSPTFLCAHEFDLSSFADKSDWLMESGPCVAQTPCCVAIGDLDGDGLPDIAITNYVSSHVYVFRNTSSGGVLSFNIGAEFSTPSNPTCLKIRDLDGDGKADLVVAKLNYNRLSILKNTSVIGNISFDPAINFITEGGSTSIETGDLDGDGKPDLVLTNQDFTISTIRNTSTPGIISFDSTVFHANVNYPLCVAIGDIDGDSKPDLAVSNYFSPNISIFRNTGSVGNIAFDTVVNFMVVEKPNNISLGDIDGDGMSDIVSVNSDSLTISVLRNLSTVGTISFAPKIDFLTGINPTCISIGDVNGDAKPDLVVVNHGANSLSVFKNTSSIGSISFAYKINFATDFDPHGVSIGDLNGDTKPDIVVPNWNSRSISIFRNTVNSTPKTPHVSQVGMILISDALLGNQWYNQNGIIIGETNQILTVTANGNYYVIVTVDTCESEPSNVISMISYGLATYDEANAIKLYPNPVKTEINVKADASLLGAEYAVYDYTGKIVLSGKIKSQSSIIEMGNLSAGIYLFRVGENMKQTFKVIKE